MSKNIKFKDILEQHKTEISTYNVNSDLKLMRYMDYSKFISLLEYKSLFLTRADKFEDPLEGIAPEGYLNKHTATSKILYNYMGLDTDKKIQEDKDLIVNKYKVIKKKTFISCWNQSDVESYALWQIYAKNNGVAIKTSANKLNALLESTNSKLYKVKYVDDDQHVIYPKIDESSFEVNTNSNLFVCKSKHYLYEQEVRVILVSEAEEADPLSIPNISGFIEEILISPFAPDWFYQLVRKQIKETYRLDIPVTRSRIKINIEI